MLKDQFEKDMAMADKFWQEFTYRHELFWSLLSKSVLVHTFLISAPLFPSGAPISLWISIPFAVVAMLFSYLSFRVLQAEVSRMAGPATLHRKLLMKHTPEGWEKDYMIYSFPPEKFILSADDINEAFPRTRSLNRFGFSRINISTESISKSKIAQIVPVVWFVYGWAAPIIIVSGLIMKEYF